MNWNVIEKGMFLPSNTRSSCWTVVIPRHINRLLMFRTVSARTEPELGGTTLLCEWVKNTCTAMAKEQTFADRCPHLYVNIMRLFVHSTCCSLPSWRCLWFSHSPLQVSGVLAVCNPWQIVLMMITGVVCAVFRNC